MDASVYTVANEDTLGNLIPNKDKNWAQEIVDSITSMLKSIPVVNVLPMWLFGHRYFLRLSLTCYGVSVKNM